MLPMARRIALVPTSIAAIVGMCMVFTRLALSATRDLPWCAAENLPRSYHEFPGKIKMQPWEPCPHLQDRMHAFLPTGMQPRMSPYRDLGPTPCSNW
jgi:hypothetical protein